MNKEDRQKLREHITRVQFKIVDAAAHIIDVVAADMKRPAEERKKQATVARRQVANLLRASQFCANKACRRSHCCRGEPLHCLQSALPLLPPEAFGELVKKKRGRAAKPRSPGETCSRTRSLPRSSAPSHNAASGIRH